MRERARNDGEPEQRSCAAEFLAAHRDEWAIAEALVFGRDRRRRRRIAERWTSLCKPTQSPALPLAVAGLRALSDTYFQDRGRGGHLADRVRRSPKHSPRQPGAWRTFADYQYDAHG